MGFRILDFIIFAFGFWGDLGVWIWVLESRFWFWEFGVFGFWTSESIFLDFGWDVMWAFGFGAGVWDFWTLGSGLQICLLDSWFWFPSPDSLYCS